MRLSFEVVIKFEIIISISQKFDDGELSLDILDMLISITFSITSFGKESRAVNFQPDAYAMQPPSFVDG